MPGVSGRPVLGGNADIQGAAAAPADQQFGHGPGGTPVIVVNAVVPVVLLGYNDHRHVHTFQYAFVGCGKDAAQKDHPIHPTVAEGVQVFHFFVRVVGGVGQQ